MEHHDIIVFLCLHWIIFGDTAKLIWLNNQDVVESYAEEKIDL